ncbi:hypothetical protein CEUSTIGMA_g13293.t1 [Chlamydomonas eustigma]|uniref:C3H1-type domain-containing protein n=1 Tax=Chlamydomonas eustigma TaxID=1157962 RepID=A0A250XS13_9CHLO|nr:hypothetical protein CEUSTIGMA_g13293.t1 [Chlamydomonas eustigma]|eukprot:GAX85877.1 hypothetical protein CEUSTIGMA_g13293.t1 [Chlamydomonas eustigma]
MGPWWILPPMSCHQAEAISGQSDVEPICLPSKATQELLCNMFAPKNGAPKMHGAPETLASQILSRPTGQPLPRVIVMRPSASLDIAMLKNTALVVNESSTKSLSPLPTTLGRALALPPATASFSEVPPPIHAAVGHSHPLNSNAHSNFHILPKPSSKPRKTVPLDNYLKQGIKMARRQRAESGIAVPHASAAFLAQKKKGAAEVPEGNLAVSQPLVFHIDAIENGCMGPSLIAGSTKHLSSSAMVCPNFLEGVDSKEVETVHDNASPHTAIFPTQSTALSHHVNEDAAPTDGQATHNHVAVCGQLSSGLLRDLGPALLTSAVPSPKQSRNSQAVVSVTTDTALLSSQQAKGIAQTWNNPAYPPTVSHRFNPVDPEDSLATFRLDSRGGRAALASNAVNVLGSLAEQKICTPSGSEDTSSGEEKKGEGLGLEEAADFQPIVHVAMVAMGKPASSRKRVLRPGMLPPLRMLSQQRPAAPAGAQVLQQQQQGAISRYGVMPAPPRHHGAHQAEEPSSTSPAPAAPPAGLLEDPSNQKDPSPPKPNTSNQKQRSHVEPFKSKVLVAVPSMLGPGHRSRTMMLWNQNDDLDLMAQRKVKEQEAAVRTSWRDQILGGDDSEGGVEAGWGKRQTTAPASAAGKMQRASFSTVTVTEAGAADRSAVSGEGAVDRAVPLRSTGHTSVKPHPIPQAEATTLTLQSSMLVEAATLPTPASVQLPHGDLSTGPNVEKIIIQSTNQSLSSFGNRTFLHVETEDVASTLQHVADEVLTGQDHSRGSLLPVSTSSASSEDYDGDQGVEPELLSEGGGWKLGLKAEDVGRGIDEEDLKDAGVTTEEEEEEGDGAGGDVTFQGEASVADAGVKVLGGTSRSSSRGKAGAKSLEAGQTGASGVTMTVQPDRQARRQRQRKLDLDDGIRGKQSTKRGGGGRTVHGGRAAEVGLLAEMKLFEKSRRKRRMQHLQDGGAGGEGGVERGIRADGPGGNRAKQGGDRWSGSSAVGVARGPPLPRTEHYQVTQALCRYFRLGRCKKGRTDCPFSHDFVPAIKRYVLCRDSKRGTCLKGDADCPFSHDPHTNDPCSTFVMHGACGFTHGQCCFSHSKLDAAAVEELSDFFKDRAVRKGSAQARGHATPAPSPS